MKIGIKTKLAFCAGLMALALCAQASFADASIVIERAANNRTLAVSYSGAHATYIELRINGASVQSRKISAEADEGETSFDIDTAALQSGKNSIEIRLYDAKGKLLGSEKSEIKIDRSGEGPVYFVSPKPDTHQQGIVEIKVGFRQQLKNVYVSFFVNDEFKILKNYSPYTYRFDTMTVPNGWHEVQAWVVDDSSATFKTEKLRLFVDNPGGRTKRPESEQIPVPTPEVKPAVKADAPEIKVPLNPTVKGSDVKPIAKPGKGAESGPKPAGPDLPKTDVKTSQPGGTITIKNDPQNPDQLVAVKTDVTTPDKPVTVKPAAPVKPPVKPTTPLKPLTITKGSRIPDLDTFDVYLDGARINFDVAPRIENGVPLAPFRHLFEGTGGEVKWDNGSKAVEGFSDGMKVWFRIGDPEAKVDGKSVHMEVAPYIESGRSIVPLSFLSDALNIRVQFDPGTGHVLIESTKSKAKN